MVLDDRELALTVEQVKHIAKVCQAHSRERANAGDEVEADVALGAFRLAMPLKRALDTWMQDRAMRAALRRPTTA